MAEVLRELTDELMAQPRPERAIPALFAVIEKMSVRRWAYPGRSLTLEQMRGHYEHELDQSVRRQPIQCQPPISSPRWHAARRITTAAFTALPFFGAMWPINSPVRTLVPCSRHCLPIYRPCSGIATENALFPCNAWLATIASSKRSRAGASRPTSNQLLWSRCR